MQEQSSVQPVQPVQFGAPAEPVQPAPPIAGGRAAGQHQALARALYECLVYADLFDCAPTLAELRRYAATVLPDETAVNEALDHEPLVELAERHGELVCLRGREALVPLRQHRLETAPALWRSARRWGRLFAAAPFVRMVAVTGTLAVENADPTDDVDFLIVTAPGRLWLCRALLLTVALGHARLAGRQYLCPNFLLTTRALALGADDRNYYVARELAQMVPLYGAATYHAMLAHNAWMATFVPNATPRWGDVAPIGVGPPDDAPQNVAERALAGALIDRLERWETRRAMGRQWQRFGQQGGDVDFGADVCRMHFYGHGARTRTRFATRLAAVPWPD